MSAGHVRALPDLLSISFAVTRNHSGARPPTERVRSPVR